MFSLSADDGEVDVDEVAGGVERLVRLSSGTEVVLRPIGPGDSDALARGYQELSVAAAYQRLHGSVAELSAAQLAYLTEVDHHDHEAIVVYEATNGHGLGEARYIRSRTDPAFAEIAVAVLDDWHGLELGHHLLEAVRDRAREEAITCLTAEVLSENAPMLALLRALGKGPPRTQDRCDRCSPADLALVSELVGASQ